MTSLLVVWSTQVNGQAGAVTGALRDAASGEPIRSASATLVRASDTLSAKTALTDAAGRFLLVGVSPEQYRIKIESLGYGTLITDPFMVEAGSTRDVGFLALRVEALHLDSVAVTVERARVSFEADRTSYHVAGMGSSHGGTVAELMRTIPELAVDFDGRITMRGSRSAVYIDGRPAPMNGMTLTAFLEHFPAAQIQRIEIIDSPSARYAAEGSGGIVNIVLREGVELGVTGSAFLTGGTRGQVGSGGHGTYQRGPLTLNGGVNIDRSNRETSSLSLRQNLLADPITFLEQETTSDRSGGSSNAALELRYHVTERAEFRLAGRWSGRDDSSEGFTTTTHQDTDRRPTSIYRRSRALDANSLTGRIGVGFDYVWDRQRHEIGVELELDNNRDRDETREGLDAINLSGATGPLPPALSYEEEREGDSAVRVSVDYLRPWADKGRVQAGYQFDESTAETKRFLRERDGAEGAPVESETGFVYQQAVSALYVTVQRQFGPLGVQFGVRGEHSATRFGIPMDEVAEDGYYTLFPTASFLARLDQGQIRLSYSRRIARPDPSVLNPIDRSTDPLNRHVGNPTLDPASTHSIGLDVTWSSPVGQLRLSPFYRRTGGTWAEITLVDRGGISTRTWDNVISQEQYGATAAVQLPRTETINGLVSVGARGQARDASNLAEDHSGRSLRWDVRASVEVVIADKLSTGLRFAYFPPLDFPQGHSDARVSADIGLRYWFPGRKGSVDVSLQDPFGFQGSSAETRDRSHEQIHRSSESSRSIQMSVSYLLLPGRR